MSIPVKYLKIEEKILNSLGKIGYVILFVIMGAILMSLVDFLLYCLIDNWYLTKFIFRGEISFYHWFDLLYNQYHYSYIKILFFSVIFLFISIYRIKSLTKIFSK